jgi:hypothetical protein
MSDRAPRPSRKRSSRVPDEETLLLLLRDVEGLERLLQFQSRLIREIVTRVKKLAEERHSGR